MKINSHNEWDKLKEVIVGHADARAGLIYSGTEPPSEKLKEKAEQLAKEAYPQWLIDEVAEDLEGLCDVLRKFGAKVMRPRKPDNKTFATFTTPFFSAAQEHCYNMRDLHLVVGNTVIESPSQERHRYFEAKGLSDIWLDYFREEGGFHWVCGPKPRLDGSHKIAYYENGKKFYKLSEDEIMFEAANTVRLGKDIIFLVSRSGNNFAAKWLQDILGGEYRVHATDKIYRSSHIDSTVLPLRPGLVLLNPQRMNEENCPDILKKWERVYVEKMVPPPQETLDVKVKIRKKIHDELAQIGVASTVELLASDWVGMNFLSLSPDTVVVDERQKDLIKTIEKYKITVIPISFRHSYMMGGIHCSTLDTVRDSKLENYFD